MGYIVSIDEIDSAKLQAELDRRQECHQRAVCSYCGLKDIAPPCKINPGGFHDGWNSRLAGGIEAGVLSTYAADIHQNALDHGWWEEQRNFGECLMLITTEVAEAMEAWRDHQPAFHWKDADDDGRMKPEGWAVEIIDVIIRCLDTLKGIERQQVERGVFEHIPGADEIIRAKMAYNVTRPHRHGNKRA